MQLDITINGVNTRATNEVGIVIPHTRNSITVFYKVVHDSDVDGASITYDAFAKHKSSDFRSKLKNVEDVEFPTTQLASISPDTESTGYFELNLNTDYSLVGGGNYVLKFYTDSTVGVSSVEVWTQTSLVNVNNVNLA